MDEKEFRASVQQEFAQLMQEITNSDQPVHFKIVYHIDEFMGGELFGHFVINDKCINLDNYYHCNCISICPDLSFACFLKEYYKAWDRLKKVFLFNEKRGDTFELVEEPAEPGIVIQLK